MRKSFIAPLVALGLLTAPANACDTALILLMDVSGSVSPSEYRLQMDGTAAALRSPAITSRVSRGQSGYSYIAVALFGHNTHWTVDWARVSDEKSLDALAGRIATMPRPRDSNTLTANAILDVMERFNNVPEACDRLVIDVSTDDIPDDWGRMSFVKQEAENRGVTINAILLDASEDDIPPSSTDATPRPTFEQIVEWAEQSLITGYNAFAMPATFEGYHMTIRAKLYAELAGELPPFRFSSLLGGTVLQPLAR